MKIPISIILYYLILLLACGEEKKPESTSSEAETQLPADFVAFYKRFHQDSAYQLSHITFPLTGILQDSSGHDSTVVWLQDNWALHKVVTPDDLWAVDFTMPLEGVVVEFIHSRSGGFYMERRFARMDTSWNLIYYAGLRVQGESGF